MLGAAGYLFGQHPPASARIHVANGLRSKSENAIGQVGDCFVENKGQWDSRAQFLLQRPGLNLWLTKDGVLLDQYKVEGFEDKTKRQGDVVKMSFAGANRTFAHGLKELPGALNFMKGVDRSKWASGVHRYAEIQTSEIYKGISARYYMENGLPRYDLIVQPGADPSQIAMKFDGAKSVMLAVNGTLKIKTSLGTIEEKGLVAYQKVKGHRDQVACQIMAKGNQTSFATGTYDHSKPLIIDPVFYSSYMYSVDHESGLGSSMYGYTSAPRAYDFMAPEQRTAYDANGNLVIVGSMASTDAFPNLVGGYHTSFSGLDADAVLIKLAATDSSLMFATYFGGSDSYTVAQGVGLNSDGTYTIAGFTQCYTFPTTGDAYMQSTGVKTTLYYFFGYMAKFNSTGGQLLDCTLFPDPISCFLVDSGGNVWIAGNGNGDTPVTDDSKDNYLNGGGYVVELDPTLSRLVFGHYFFGGSQVGAVPPVTYFRPKAMLLKGTTVYVMADHEDWSVIPGIQYAPIKPTPGAAFTTGTSCIEAYNTKAGKILGITLLQASLMSMALMPNGNLVVAGPAVTGMPTTAGAFQKTAGPQFSHYIAVLSPSLTNLVAATYFGSGETSPYMGVKVANYQYSSVGDLRVDSDGNIVICGTTFGSNTPTTAGASMPSFDPTLNGLAYWDLETGYIAKFSADLKSLLYSSLLPGIGMEIGGANNALDDGDQLRLLLDTKSNALILGEGFDNGFGTSTTFSPTPNALLKEPFPNNQLTFLMGINMTPGPKMAIAQPGVIGGGSTTCTMTLPAAAPAGGLKVPLKMIPVTSSITIPSSVTFPAGQTQATFTIATLPVVTKQHVAIQAQFGTDYQEVLFTDLTPQIVSVSATPLIEEEGYPMTVTVKLNAPPADGFSVEIDSYDRFDTLVFKANQTTATKTISIGDFTVDNPDYSGPAGNWFAPQFSLSVMETENADPLSFTLNQTNVTAGTSLTGTVTLDGENFNPTDVIKLTSSDAAAAYIPSSITLDKGATGFTVPIKTFGVSAATKITLTAIGYQTSATTSFVLEPAGIVSLTASSLTVPLKGTDICTVLLTGLAPAGAVATLSSSNSAAASVPATCALSKSSDGSTFAVTAGSVTAKTPVTISATYGGATRSTTITVLPNGPSSIAFHYAYVYGGQVQIATVSTFKPVATATAVSLASSDPTDAPVAATVTVAANSSSASFTITPKGVAAAKPITITATSNGVSASASFEIQPSPLYALTLTSSSIGSYSSTTCTVHLNGYAPPVGAVVSLKSNNPAAVVPTTVTVPAQTNNATFTIVTTKVSAATTVTIMASYGGVTKTINLTVNP